MSLVIAAVGGLVFATGLFDLTTTARGEAMSVTSVLTMTAGTALIAAGLILEAF